MGKAEPDYKAIQELIVPLMVLEHDIFKHMYLKPSAVMLPSEYVPEGSSPTAFGVPVIAGDRAALIYEPPKARTD